LVDSGRSKEQERRKKNTNPNLKGDISLLEIPRKNVGTATRLGILEETIRKRKRRLRRKITIIMMTLKNILERMVEMSLLQFWQPM